MDKYGWWKNAVKGKSIRLNVDKTKSTSLLFGKKSSVSELDPCGVCGEWIGCNSIQHTKCQRWVHRHFFDVPMQVSLLSCWDVFVCTACLGHNCSVEEKLEFKRDEDVLQEVEKFCYLGDMISCYGGASEAVTAIIGSAWKKSRKLSNVLVGKQGLSLKQGGIYQCCANVGTYLGLIIGVCYVCMYVHLILLAYTWFWACVHWQVHSFFPYDFLKFSKFFWFLFSD